MPCQARTVPLRHSLFRGGKTMWVKWGSVGACKRVAPRTPACDRRTFLQQRRWEQVSGSEHVGRPEDAEAAGPASVHAPGIGLGRLRVGQIVGGYVGTTDRLTPAAASQVMHMLNVYDRCEAVRGPVSRARGRSPPGPTLVLRPGVPARRWVRVRSASQQGWPGRAQGSCSYCPLTPQHVFDIEGTLRVQCSVQYKLALELHCWDSDVSAHDGLQRSLKNHRSFESMPGLIVQIPLRKQCSGHADPVKCLQAGLQLAAHLTVCQAVGF